MNLENYSCNNEGKNQTKKKEECIRIITDIRDHIESAQSYKNLLINNVIVPKENYNRFMSLLTKDGKIDFQPHTFLFAINVCQLPTFFYNDKNHIVSQCENGRGRSLHDNWLTFKSYYDCSFFEFMRIALELVVEGIYITSTLGKKYFSYAQAYMCPCIKRYLLTFTSISAFHSNAHKFSNERYRRTLNMNWKDRLGYSSTEFGMSVTAMWEAVYGMDLTYPDIEPNEEFINLLNKNWDEY